MLELQYTIISRVAGAYKILSRLRQAFLKNGPQAMVEKETRGGRKGQGQSRDIAEKV